MRLYVPMLLCTSLWTSAVAAGQAKSAEPPWVGMAVTWQETDGRRHLLVERVTPNGPASRAGVKPGDLVTHINDQRADFGDDLDFLLFVAERKPGERLRIRAIRHGQAKVLTMVLGTLPESGRAAWQRNLAMARERRAEREQALRKE